jgi:hypothetical protein
MKNIINLLPESAVEGSRRLAFFRTLRIILIAITMVCLVFTIGIWALSLLIGKEVAAENLKLQDLEAKIMASSKKEQQFYLLTHQLNKAGELLNSRFQIEKKLNAVMTAFPPDVNLSSAKIDTSGKNISVTLSADTLEKMIKVVTAAKLQPFSSVKVNDFSRGSKGEYLIDLTVEVL